MLSDVSTLSYSPPHAQRASFSQGQVGSHQWHTALPWMADRCHTDRPCCCATEAPRRVLIWGWQDFWDLASWWERSRGEEGGPGLAVGVLPLQHSFHPDARFSLKGPGPHTLKPVNSWEDQSSLCSRKWRCPVSIPQAGTALPPEPFNREWESMSWKLPILGITWLICLNSGYLFWLLYIQQNLWIFFFKVVSLSLIGVLKMTVERRWDIEKCYLWPLVTCLVGQVVGCYFLLMTDMYLRWGQERERQVIATSSTSHGDQQRNPWTCLEGKESLRLPHKHWQTPITKVQVSPN